MIKSNFNKHVRVHDMLLNNLQSDEFIVKQLESQINLWEEINHRSKQDSQTSIVVVYLLSTMYIDISFNNNNNNTINQKCDYIDLRILPFKASPFHCCFCVTLALHSLLFPFVFDVTGFH